VACLNAIIATTIMSVSCGNDKAESGDNLEISVLSLNGTLMEASPWR